MTQKSQSWLTHSKTLLMLGLAGLVFVGTSTRVSYAQVPSNLAISEEFGGNTANQNNDVGEGTFTTQPGTPSEGTFTTLNDDSGGGGGGGGGGGRSRRGRVLGATTPALGPCQPYLLKYIKYGVVNDPDEVRKLQAFLRVFEGHNLAITGTYDLPTYNAVHAFQRKYQKDVLGPWAINHTTGYVFITTTMAINNVFCSRSTANTLDLRNYYPDIVDAPSKTGGSVTIPWDPTWTVATTTIGIESSSFTAATGALQFIKDWWFIVLLILILLVLGTLVWRMRDDEDVAVLRSEDELEDLDTMEGEEVIQLPPETDSRQQKLDDLS